MFLGMFRTAFFLMSICCCSFYWCHGCLEEERIVLLQIKDSINYPCGYSLDGDWVGKNCCQWQGVDCDPSSSRVISINLNWTREERLGIWYPNTSLFAAFKELKDLNLMGNQIGGWVMPQAFSEMQSLRELDLFSNNLCIDSLQGLCELKDLRSLDLGENNLDGRAFPPCLSNQSRLEGLSLFGNNLGSYPSALTSLCELKDLRRLDLGEINLDGRALPPCLSNLSRLEGLGLNGNHLGSYPSALTGICELTTLRWLSLDWNGLNDHSMPKCLGNLSLLEELFLQDNELKSYLTALSGMQSLRKLNLNSNNLSAGIDSLRGLCELKDIRVLFLEENNLDGRALPSCLSNLSKLEALYLWQNDLGSYPSALTGICELTKLRVLELDRNRLNDHSIPKCLGSLSLLEELSLSGNELKSPFSSLTGELRKLLGEGRRHRMSEDDLLKVDPEEASG